MTSLSTTMTEYIPYVIGYLVEQAQASPYLGQATPAVPVLDGPPTTADPLTVNPGGVSPYLWIASAGSPAFYSRHLEAGAPSPQGSAFLDQARTRDDQIDIPCAAECGSGDGNIAAARGTGGLDGGGAFGVMAAVEVMLRGSPPAGPGDASMGGLVAWSEVTGPISYSTVQKQSGAWVLVTFRVTAFVRLTS